MEVSFVTLNDASVKVCKAQKLFPGGRGRPLSHPLDIGRVRRQLGLGNNKAQE